MEQATSISRELLQRNTVSWSRLTCRHAVGGPGHVARVMQTVTCTRRARPHERRRQASPGERSRARAQARRVVNYSLRIF